MSNLNLFTTDDNGIAQYVAEENSTLVALFAVPPAAISFRIVGGADATRFTIDATTGALSFIEPPNFEAPGSAAGTNVYDVQVEATDGTVTDVQAVAITIADVNEAPTAVADTVAATEDQVLTIDAATLLANDTDPDTVADIALQIASVASGSGGTAVLNADGSVSFTPNADFNGAADFSYTTTDGTLVSAPVTVAVQVAEVNDAPVVADEALAPVAENSTARTISFASLLANDGTGPANEAGQSLTISAVGNAVGGTVAIVGTDVVFTPAADFHGQASFDYTVVDNGTTSGTADPQSTVGTAHFAISFVNDAPDHAATLNRLDLEFVLEQIRLAENNQPPVSPHLAYGLREVGGTNNNTVPGNGSFGASDLAFPRATAPVYRTVTVSTDGTIFDAHPGIDGDTMTTSYAVPAGSAGGFGVIDSAPRTISNLIADQTEANPAAKDAQTAALGALGIGYQNAHNPATPGNVDAAGNLFIPNITPDAGLSAPFNTWFTLFGQFFDHGVDLVSKGGSSAVFIPLAADDPLRVLGPDGVADTGDEVPAGQAFMVLTRATTDAGADGLLGTADDVNNAGTNTITPFVDQSQTYSSHPSHQVFLREYVQTGIGGANVLHSTGRMLSHVNADGSEHMATWADLKANALTLGLLLTDADVNSVPLLATDAYGNATFGPNGFVQVVVRHADGSTSLVEGTAGGLDLHALPAGDSVVGIGHAFINDKAFAADPFNSDGTLKAVYDHALLDAHYVAGDGRVNENIGLTAVHDVFHGEHNRQIAAIKALVQAELDKGDHSFAANWVLPGVSLFAGAGGPHQIAATEWDGERLFQAAKFATETQYQHLVFEEFARKVSPTIHLFGNNDIHLDPAITAEFTHAVYRFGHSMLDENVNRYVMGPDGTPVIGADGHPVMNEIGLIQAFTNPLAYLDQGGNAAGEIVLGTTNQVGNEIDEFVTGALRNNLLGLPLDLAALNIARGRETGIAPLNVLRNDLFHQTGDTTLKPYDSWDDFGQFLKHPASLVNFVAAYGTHASIASADTLVDKRAAALDLVKNASHTLIVTELDGSSHVEVNPGFSQDAYDFMHSLGAYANDLNNPLAVNAQWSTGSVTGLDTVDLWIGGLAEKQNLFGGLLGSTFNFIFETQMEALQDADRLYYLPRIEGTHFGIEIESNTFASMIMANTGTHHVGANVFMTPEYVVEVGSYYVKNPDGSFAHNPDGSVMTLGAETAATWLHNPQTDKQLVDIQADGTIHFLGDDNFLGNTIVMGGTAEDDKILSGNADDDTVYGDAGNDTLDGGGGNDVVFGGSGNDTITDVAGDDILHGDSGDDTIDGGIGDDILLGGSGNDILDGGNGIDDVQGGDGNDILYGGEDDDEMLGQGGDDWLEGGDGGDILVGDLGAPTGQVPWFAANDVLIGGAQGDKMDGFSGDDIMLGEGGFDKFLGHLGFDWASFENESHGISADMEKREFIPAQIAPAGDAVRDFWVETEGVSGSRFDDFIQGTNDAKIDTFNELANVNLIQGVGQYFPAGPVAFSGGNIMLGGGGSDFLAGRAGNDIIDGDARLHVELTTDADGHITHQSQIVREILFDQGNVAVFDQLEYLDASGNPTSVNTGVRNPAAQVLAAGDIDTAVFGDVSTNYQISIATDANGNVLFGNDGNVVLQVQHIVVPGVVLPAGIVNDGTDTLYNIERLQFSDITIDNPFTAVTDFAAQGVLTVNDGGVPLAAATPPLVGDVLSVTSTVFDIEGVSVGGVVDPATLFGGQIPLNELNLQWQYQDAAHPTWVNIVGATGTTFTPTSQFVGAQLRVTASFTDGLGVQESVSSAPTAILGFNAAPAANQAPTLQTQVAVPSLPDTTALADTAFILNLPLTTVFTDDQTASNLLTYTATLSDGTALATAGLAFVAPVNAAGVLVSDGVISGTPPAGFHGTIDILVTATDAAGLSVTDTFTINVLPAPGDFSAPGMLPPPAVAEVPHDAATLNRLDLEFVLEQIHLAESNQPPVSPHLAYGLREVGGTNNNTVPGNGSFGASDLAFPRATAPVYRTVTINTDGTIFDAHPDVDGDTITTSYAVPNGGANPADLPEHAPLVVYDAAPRTISNLIADQTAGNPAALDAQLAALGALGDGYLSATNPATPGDVDAAGNLFIPNVTPDGGLSAPFNTWFTLFGQFFDHGVDLVSKGGSSAVFIPLAADDPLRVVGPDGVAGTGDEVPAGQAFMVLTRATTDAGADGLLGTADDVNNAGTNTITPFVDQSQTYSSHPSHQVFLREYVQTGIGGANVLHSTGRMLSHVNADGSEHMATWADLKANALTLGLLLTDADVNSVPLLATDAYGNATFGPNGFVQVVVRHADGSTSLVEGTAGGLDLHALPAGDSVVGIGHAFINDKAFAADPFNSDGTLKAVYDHALLDAHYVAGDGRVNENIGLTAVHDVFHGEHNRQIAAIKALVQAELDKGDHSFAANWVLPGVSLFAGAGGPHQIAATEWDGERLFQAAKFATETQYQHLVFEEFARKVSPTIHLFGNNDIHLDPAITAEFAHAVYRFGHSMLDENVNRYVMGPDGTPVMGADGHPVMNEIGLIQAFTNPLAYLNQGGNAAGEIVLGTTNQVGNEIDEFVTGALRNNLLGLPLDLAALNIARGRETGVAPLNVLRNDLFHQTGDTTLKPYDSWDDFGQFLKHPASLVNFVAAYGTHSTIDSATTLADKRTAALHLVENASHTITVKVVDDPLTLAFHVEVRNNENFSQDAYDFMHSLGAYANDLNNPLAVHSQWSTGSITGLDTVDLWIGGLAEKQNLFGGLLGSTFNFIFETQMEALQDADRLYYLPRIEGTHFGIEIESNTFASMIMANTGTHHVGANVFMTPEYVVEVGSYYVKNPDGSFAHNPDGSVMTLGAETAATWLHNPQTGKQLVDILPDGTIHFLGDDNFLGNTIVMGGTAEDDKILSGNADDDTVYGDGGNDTLDGGGGNDVVFGGTGNDTITDVAGDDILHGDSGDDRIDGGIGDDILLGGDGNDILDGGNGIDDVQGGSGNDILYGGEDDDEMLGQGGDDWLEGGAGGDILVGDLGAPTGQIPWFAGNDVLIGGTSGDKMDGFSGDDIMLGEGGFDKFLGHLGFDWASFERETHGVSADMAAREFIPAQVAPAGDAVRDFWVETEGVSGSQYGDYIQGTNDAKLDPFNELANVNLIQGVAQYFPAGPVAFSGGNIMLGGGGSDFLAGRAGNDIIDGDAHLHVELTTDADGHITHQSQIVREILFTQANAPEVGPDGAVVKAGDIDTAMFGDVSTNYQISIATDANGNVLFGHDGNVALQVQHIVVPGVVLPAGIVNDGTDTLYNIERLQFSDITIDNPFTAVTDFAAQGVLTVNDGGVPLAAATPPLVGDVLSVTSTVFDIEGVSVGGVVDPTTVGGGVIPLNELNFQWQYQDVAHPLWVDIAGATGTTFTTTDLFVGAQLRVVASFTDGLGVQETVSSAPTAILAFNTVPAANRAPTLQTQVAVMSLPDTTAQKDAPFTVYLPLTTVFTDDQTASNLLTYTATLANGAALPAGWVFTPPVNAAGVLVSDGVLTGTPAPGFSGQVAILVTATDAAGLSVTDTFTINVLPNAAPVITSNGGGAAVTVGIQENTTEVATVAAKDLNPLDVLTYAIVGGADQAAFSIDAATGALSFVVAPDFEAPSDAGLNNVFDVVVQVSDGTLTDRQAIAVRVTPANDIDPVITSDGGGDTAALIITENDTAVTTVTATDADLPAQTITFSIAGGADAARFTIDAATGALSFVAAPDFEAPADADGDNVYDVVVQANDNGLPSNLVDTQAISVMVTNQPGVHLIGDAGDNLLTGTPEEDWLEGLGGNDTLVGLGGDDLLDGGTDNDTIDGGLGADTMIGGDGSDSFVVDNAGDTVLENPGEGTDTVQTTLASYSLAALPDVENLSFTGVGNFSGTGNDTDNVIIGGAGNDTLTGGGGNDTLTGQAGADSFAVDAGTDTVTDLANGDTLVVSAGATANATVANAFTATAATRNDGSANLASAGFNVTLAAATGSSGFRVVNTGLAAAFIGSANADELIGGAGNDTFTGGGGNDSFGVTAGTDTVTDLSAGDALVVTAGATANATVTAAFTATAATSNEGTANLTSAGIAVSLAAAGGTNGFSVTNTGAAASFVGSANADTLLGGTGNDTLDGGAGNDLINGRAGADAMTGGAGDDTFVVDNVGDTVVEAAGGGTDTIQTTLNTFTLVPLPNVENLSFTGAGAFTGTGNGANNVIIGGGGNDTLTGGGGNDTFTGGAGNDRFNVDAGTDAITDLAGADVLVVSAGATANATVTANFNATAATINSGIATLSSAGFNVNLGNAAGAGGFTVTNTGNAANFTGSGNADVLNGGAANDNLSGGGGADTLTGGGGNDNLTGGAGNDSFNVTLGTDSISDLSGSDVLVVAAGATVNATVSAAFTATAATSNAGTANLTSNGNGVNLAAATGTSGFSVTNNGAAATFTGSAQADTLTGGTGADTLNGGGGNDTLDGRTGADAMAGGAGDDTYVVDNAADTVTENAGAGTDTVQTTLASFSLAATPALGNVENLTSLGAGAFTGTGNALNNVMTGGTGADTLSGAGGNDTLRGGAGADVLNGGADNDTLDGGLGVDTLTGGTGNDTLTGGGGNNTFNVDAGTDTITDLSNGDAFTVSAGATANATLASGFTATAATSNAGTANLFSAGTNVNLAAATGTGGYNVSNSGGAATFTGSNNADSLSGGAANDTLNGGGGNDTLNGGGGNDALTGGAGNDSFVVTSGTDSVTDLSTGDVLTVGAGAVVNATVAAGGFTAAATTSNAGTATLNSAGNAVNLAAATGSVGYTVNSTGTTASFTGSSFADTLNGATGADTLNGGGGNDVISGGAGGDTINGGTGNDILSGGAAADNFVFNAALVAANVDTLTDFLSGTDKLQLSRSIFSVFTVGGSVGIVDAGLASAGGHNIVYDSASGAVYYDATGGAHGDAVQIALLGQATHPGSLATADFVVIN